MAGKNENPVLKAALSYHQQNWCIIPVPLGSKKARIYWGKYQTERPDEKQIRNWFGNGQTNLAVILGKISGGLTCMDFDELAAYEAWSAHYPDISAILPTAKTARGRHVFFLSDLTKSQKIEGGDLKASGYCLLHPSLHPTGIEYQWLIPPNGSIPFHNSLEIKGWLFTEETDETEETEETEDTEAIKGGRGEFEDKNVENAIVQTLPQTEGQRNQCIFQFCRYLKAIESIAVLPASKIKAVVKQWHERALPVIGTKPFDETWADFTYGWSRVKWPKGGNDTLRKAIENALQARAILPEAQDYDSKEARLLVRISFELQKQTKPEPFWLSCHDLGKILRVSHTQANRLLHMLVADGILKIAVQGTKKRATRYFYLPLR